MSVESGPARLLVPLLLAAALVVPLPAEAADATPTCQGRAATVVGEVGGTVRGSTGPDVIVTAGAARVVAGRGADRICVTGRSDVRVRVDAGPGADRIVVTRSGGFVEARLGPGDDRYTGGAGNDRVLDHTNPDEPNGRDVIDTGGGYDRVRIIGVADKSRDRVRLGSGRDELWLAGRGAPGPVLDTGSGSDEISLVGGGTGLVVDNRSGTATLGGTVWWRWRHVERFRTSGALREVRFLGSEVAERINLANVAEAVLGGGDDAVEAYGSHERALRRIDGGPGRDRLGVSAVHRVVVDLTAGSLWSGDGGGTVVLVGIEDVDVFSVTDVAEVVGTDGPNRIGLVGSGCRTVVDAGAGDDVVRRPVGAWRQDDPSGCPEPGARVAAGAGDDTVLLDARAWYDEADGGEGSDRCVADVVVACES